jgi:hypothetical protein
MTELTFGTATSRRLVFTLFRCRGASGHGGQPFE